MQFVALSSLKQSSQTPKAALKFCKESTKLCLEMSRELLEYFYTKDLNLKDFSSIGGTFSKCSFYWKNRLKARNKIHKSYYVISMPICLVGLAFCDSNHSQEVQKFSLLSLKEELLTKCNSIGAKKYDCLEVFFSIFRCCLCFSLPSVLRFWGESERNPPEKNLIGLYRAYESSHNVEICTKSGILKIANMAILKS